MKLTTRMTHGFIEIKTNEIETTVFKSDQKEIYDTIQNLIDVIRDLLKYTDTGINIAIVDDDTGEAVEIHPPAKSQGETLAITFK